MKNLSEIKSKINLFVFDFDDTIKSSSERDCKPLDLVEKIISNDKFVGIITASGVSVLSTLAEQIIQLIRKNGFNIPVYLGIANGMALYKLDKNGRQEVYSYPIELDYAKEILEVWKNVMKKIGIEDEDLMEKGVNTFKEFLLRDWNGYIPNESLSLSKENNGKCFVEKFKITFVMPKNDVFLQQDFISLMQMEINKKFGDDKFVIEMGNDIFAHLTKKPGMAPKLFALKKIMKNLNLENDQVAAFGDMPFGNDKGLLIDSGLPYTFTNKNIEKENIETPPFVLDDSELTPVASVYKAVENLLY